MDCLKICQHEPSSEPSRFGEGVELVAATARRGLERGSSVARQGLERGSSVARQGGEWFARELLFARASSRIQENLARPSATELPDKLTYDGSVQVNCFEHDTVWVVLPGRWYGSSRRICPQCIRAEVEARENAANAAADAAVAGEQGGAEGGNAEASGAATGAAAAARKNRDGGVGNRKEKPRNLNATGEALWALYERFDGSKWSMDPAKPWHGTENNEIQKWFGVSCEDSEGTKKLRLNLKGVKLVGEMMELVLPLLQLPQLEEVDFSGNELKGMLPRRLVSLTALTHVSLVWNKLTGPLHASWSAMTQLRLLDLSNNLLTGKLPSEWSALTNLTTLRLSTNRLTDKLPSSWSNMAALEELCISYNRLEGGLPRQWSALSSLKVLYLRNNHLTGAFPDQWARMLKLQRLILDNNSFDFADKPGGENEELQRIRELFTKAAEADGMARHARAVQEDEAERRAANMSPVGWSFPFVMSPTNPKPEKKKKLAEAETTSALSLIIL